MKIIRIWCAALLIQFLLISCVWYLTSHSTVIEESSDVIQRPTEEQQPDHKDPFTMTSPVETTAPVVDRIEQAETILRINEEEEQIAAWESWQNQCLKIEEGLVSMSCDEGDTWIEVPAYPSDLKDYWLDYLRMGAQSYYMDEESALLAYTTSQGETHLLVLDDGGLWQNVTFKIDGQNVMQMSISKGSNGIFHLVMLMQDGSVCLGESKEGLTWTFADPGYLQDASSTSSSMNVYGVSLMDDGAILIVTYQLDCAISKDGGKSFSYLMQDLMGKDPMEETVRISTNAMPYDDHQGTYCVPLSDGSLLISTDGMNWQYA